MNKNELIELITKNVIQELTARGKLQDVSKTVHHIEQTVENAPQIMADSASVIEVMKKKTNARIGVGKAGPRLRTDTLLNLRADHAMAKDAVLSNVNEQILHELGLFQVQSLCKNITEHLTRPDLGRKLDEDTKEVLRSRCEKSPQVQIYVSDGLSNLAIDENISDILPVMMDEFKARGIRTGTPFFVKYGRVPTMDVVSEVLDAEVTCVLIGERPGLAAADSMSAYMAYKAKVGMPESRRTVISNIHAKGIQAVEAGAYAVDVMVKMLEHKKSGVELKL